MVSSKVVSSLLSTECYSPARIERELDWQAEVGLEAGLNEMIGDETGF